jgi:hypothetical protein
MPKAYCSICEKDFFIHKTWLDIANDFPERKQEYLEMQCPENKTHLKILREKEVKKVPIETKQKVLDLLRAGKNIGTIRAELNLSLDVTCEIITQNIEEIPILRKEAI